MKESIGGTQLFIIVITLVLLFSGIMALTINRSNSFTTKDRIINIIEKHGGFDMNAELINGNEDAVLSEIVDSLQEIAYRQTGKCPEADFDDDFMVSAYQRNGSKSVGNNDSSFCIVRYNGTNKEGTAKVYYYKVIVFYHLDLPVVKNIFNFKTSGETKALYS